MARTDVLVVPSLWYETAALVIQEAFAAGVPVIAPRLGALQERVHHGQDGFLYPPGDCQALATVLSRLVGDPQLLKRLQRNIQPVTTVDQHVARVSALYDRLVSSTDRE